MENKQEYPCIWILYAFLAPLFLSLGNAAYGISCVTKGFWGPGFLAPCNLVVVLVWKIIDQVRFRRANGKWIDKSHSNYFKDGKFNC